MKFKRIFFLLAIAMPGTIYAASPLSGTSGGNLTSFNGSMGSINNNGWNSMANSKPAPTADFGNCNALILRCAQPKCASGGCTDMNVATPIVSGCVNANESCKSYGDDLIQYIAAQLVASSTAKANETAAANAQANSQAASQQSAAQLEAMQSQMQSMQEKMTQQNEQSTAAMQAALIKQNELIAQQQATNSSAQQNNIIASAPQESVQNAVDMGVSAEVLVRQQASGQIMTSIENAEDSLKALKKIMQTTFDYAGCDASGNNCSGPKRIAVFKEKAAQFFDPYENVLDETYDALIMAQSLGVDITDIYMMLNNSCNAWGKYLCTGDQNLRYANCMSGTDGCVCGGSNRPCPPTDAQKGKVASISDGGCQLVQMLTTQDDIQQNWLYPDDESANGGGRIEVGCASEAIDNSVLFKSRKKQASIDIEVLQRIIEQDAPTYLGDRETAEKVMLPYCAVNSEMKTDLEKNTRLKKLPKNVCVAKPNGTK